MLVLSRRPSEKILFPGIGISVEIIQTRGNTVRVGIEAPREIRVLREELAEPADFELKSPLKISDRTTGLILDEKQQQAVCGQIDEIGLAIALAQNQQRQGLSDNVNVVLEQAIERLQELKAIVESDEPSTRESAGNALVCESGTKYNSDPNPTSSMIGEKPADSKRKLSFLDLDYSSTTCVGSF